MFLSSSISWNLKNAIFFLLNLPIEGNQSVNSWTLRCWNKVPHPPIHSASSSPNLHLCHTAGLPLSLNYSFHFHQPAFLSIQYVQRYVLLIEIKVAVLPFVTAQFVQGSLLLRVVSTVQSLMTYIHFSCQRLPRLGCQVIRTCTGVACRICKRFPYALPYQPPKKCIVFFCVLAIDI